jgi:hypothetical protein
MKHKRSTFSHPASTPTRRSSDDGRSWFRQGKSALRTMISSSVRRPSARKDGTVACRRLELQCNISPNTGRAPCLDPSPTPAARDLTAAILRAQISVRPRITACEQSLRVSKRRSSQRRLPIFPDRRLKAFRASLVQANSLAHFWSGMLIKITGTS